jgi:succinate-semialdehyde dehydrogenase / glutarate-semialdehyde dehydrogenase
MTIESINPFTEERVESAAPMDAAAVEAALALSARVAPDWAATPVDERACLLAKLGDRLLEHKEECARLITREMGKCLRESIAEVEKCAWLCEYYAETAPAFLAEELIATAASKSYVAYQPLGTVLGIMPWNFPFWQVIRYVTPALTAGNTTLMKHAANVPACARMIEHLFREAGYPAGVFQTLFLENEQVRPVIEDARVHAVTLTGSERAGSIVAAQAGAALKKTVLELGGSDAFIVLEDADLELAVESAVKARFQANGQSCIAAKRFIVVDAVAEAFSHAFRDAAGELRHGGSHG